MGPEKAAAYLKDIGSTSAIIKVIKTGYHAINLIHFFTSGEDEVRCWTVRVLFSSSFFFWRFWLLTIVYLQKYTKAPVAAGSIHSDMQNGFICAEVMKYPTLLDFRYLSSTNDLI